MVGDCADSSTESCGVRATLCIGKQCACVLRVRPTKCQERGASRLLARARGTPVDDVQRRAVDRQFENSMRGVDPARHAKRITATLQRYVGFPRVTLARWELRLCWDPLQPTDADGFQGAP